MKKFYPFLILTALSLLSCEAMRTGRAHRNAGTPNPGEKALGEGDLETALDWFEAATARDPERGELWRSLGEAQILFAEDRMAQGGSGLSIGSTLLDAKTSLDKAETLLGTDSRTAALQARLLYHQGQFEEAEKWAETAQKRLTQDAPADLRFVVGRAAAEASFQRYVEMRQSGAPPEELAFPFSRTFQALRACETARPADPWAYAKQADLFQWEQAKQGVVDALQRGLSRSPSEASLHAKLQDYLAQQNDVPGLLAIYETLGKEHPQEPVTIWYEGLARLREADLRRSRGDTTGASAGYERAKTLFTRSASIRPEFRDSVDHYLTISEFSRAWCLYTERKIEEAAAAWTNALANRPDLKDASDGLGRTAKEGLGFLGGEYFAAKEFEKGRLLHRKLTEIDPQDADWMNNYAFLCREAGVAAATADKPEAADALFEESYAAYEKAAVLAPDDPRIVNDCALILLYHLDRNLDRAESMFRKAIAIGEEALAMRELTPSQEEEIRSATGDAYQNLGVLYFEKKRDPLGSRPFFQKSLEVDSVARPQVQWFWNRIVNMEAKMRDWFMIWVPAILPLLSQGESLGQGEEKSATKAESADKNGVADRLHKAASLLEGGSINDALDLLDEIERESPDLPETNFLYGKAYLLKAEGLAAQGVTSNQVSFAFMDAARYLSRATEQNATHGEAWRLLGKAQFASNEIDAAAAAAEKATHFLPQSPEAFQLRGEIAFQRYHQARNDEDAEGMKTFAQIAMECFQKSAKLSDRFAPAWEKLGDLYSWTGKDAEAKNAYVKAMGLAPQEAVGSRLLQRAAPKEWVELFEKALAESKKIRGESDKANAILHWYLGYAQLGAKQPVKARDAFLKASQLDPELLNSFYYLGRIEYFDTKNYLDSARAFAAYAAKNPDSLTALVKAADQAGDNLSSVIEFLVGHAYDKKEWGVSRDLAKISAFLEPEKAKRWNDYAFFCRETGKYEDSYAAYSQAVELDPENPQLLNDCALILQYHLFRDLDKAKEMYEKAIANARLILDGKMKTSASQEEVRIALRDAGTNLAKLKLRPQGEKSGE